ncbi:MAG: hydrolase TatD [Candidatus Dojkabacteria bacterium]|nr:MAG: hydrolase TatD [Candidatus Dojkabacteria bacterium]
MNSTDLLKIKTYFDSHAHLNDDSFDLDRPSVITDSINKGVDTIFDVAIDFNSSKKAIKNAQEFYPHVIAFIGIDPEVFINGSSLFEPNANENWIYSQVEKLRSLINKYPNYIGGIGETGLDFYWLTKKVKSGEISQIDKETSINLQKKLFEAQVELAKEFDLILTVHSRGAEEDCLKIINKHRAQAIFHSFTGEYETAKKILDSGLSLGINGIFTFPNANKLRSVYKKIFGKVSHDWSIYDFYSRGIFFETDCPFLAPQVFRGSRNSPANIPIIYDYFVNYITS